MSSRSNQVLLGLAEDVLAGRRTREDAGAAARNLDARGEVELDSLLVALRAVGLHAKATRAAGATAPSAAVPPLAVPPAAAASAPGEGLGTIRRVRVPRVLPRWIAGQGRALPAEARGSRHGALARFAAVTVALLVVVAVLQGSFGLVERRAPAAAGSPAVEPALAFRPATTIPGAKLMSVAEANGRYVVVGTRYGPGSGTARPTTGAAWTSTDGVTWKEASADAFAGGFIFGVAARADGTTVAVGSTGRTSATADRQPAVWRSPDAGVSWEVVPGAVPAGVGGLRGVTVLGDRFVAVGTLGVGSDHAFAAESADGITWQRVGTIQGATGRGLSGVTAGGPGVVGWGYRVSGSAHLPAIWSSSDGLTWSLADVGSADSLTPKPGAGTTNATGSAAGAVQEVVPIGGVLVAFTTGSAGDTVTLQSTDARRWAPLAAAGFERFTPNGAFSLDPGVFVVGTHTVGDAGSGAILEAVTAGEWRSVSVASPTPDGWTIRAGAGARGNAVLVGGAVGSAEAGFIFVAERAP